jgi:hypothetical protein
LKWEKNRNYERLIAGCWPCFPSPRGEIKDEIHQLEKTFSPCMCIQPWAEEEVMDERAFMMGKAEFLQSILSGCGGGAHSKTVPAPT